MELKSGAAQAALSKINAKCGTIKCPMCQKVGFSLDTTEFHLPSFIRNGKDVDLGSLTYIPAVACTCNNCGYISFFNLIALGVDFQ